MRVVVIGGSGLIGAKVVINFQNEGHDAVAASPSCGVDALTGDGLADVLEDAFVVVDPHAPYFGTELSQR
jgi:nucleoside-diphosphate-sugar epimerase